MTETEFNELVFDRMRDDPAAVKSVLWFAAHCLGVLFLEDLECLWEMKGEQTPEEHRVSELQVLDRVATRIRAELENE